MNCGAFYRGFVKGMRRIKVELEIKWICAIIHAKEG